VILRESTAEQPDRSIPHIDPERSGRLVWSSAFTRSDVGECPEPPKGRTPNTGAIRHSRPSPQLLHHDLCGGSHHAVSTFV